MAATDWLPWVNLVLIIIVIIILIVGLLFGTGFITASNYRIIELSGSDANVQMPTGDNFMGLSKASINQTVTVQSNSGNIRGQTFGISNTSDPSDNFIITVAEGSGVSIDFGGAGNMIVGGEVGLFIANNNNNSFTRYQ